MIKKLTESFRRKPLSRTRMCKSLAILIVFTVFATSLVAIHPSLAIPPPTIQEFTLQTVKHPYAIPTTVSATSPTQTPNSLYYYWTWAYAGEDWANLVGNNIPPVDFLAQFPQALYLGQFNSLESAKKFMDINYSNLSKVHSSPTPTQISPSLFSLYLEQNAIMILGVVIATLLISVAVFMRRRKMRKLSIHQ
jgi:hypothetical protein